MLKETSYKDWFEKTAHKLSGNGIWLRGQEINTLPLTEFENRNFRVLFTRLSTYKDTSNSFTHKLLYQIAKNIEGIFPDLAYLPPNNDTKFFDVENIPWMLPAKTKIHPTAFDFIGFSNSIVQEIINIPVMLQKSNIPIYKSRRIDDENMPLIIIGGANAVNSSILCTEDPLVDGIFIGEDSGCIKEILEICRDGKKNNIKKSAILNLLENVSGFFQPEKVLSANKKIIKKFSLHTEQLKDAPVLYSDEAGSGILRISEGCPYFCSFCSESWNRKPYTEESAENLLKAALELKANSGLSNIELYSFNFNIHSELYIILMDLSGIFANAGLKSQRFDHISKNPDLLKILQVVGKSSITCGLEGISGRMRKYLHKNLEDNILFKSLDYLVKSHIRELKIFLIATGKESDEDFKDFSKLLGSLNNMLYGLKHKPRIIFSTTPLVRFPLTPLEFEDAPLQEIIKTILEKINTLVKGSGFESRVAADFNEYYISQILVRTDNAQVINALIQSINKTGFVYYNGIPDRFIKEFNEQILSAKISPLSLLKGHNIEERVTKTWHLFETGISNNYLVKTFNGCIEFNENEACFGEKKCNGCEACPDNTFIKKITHAAQLKLYSSEELHKKIIARRNNITTINFIFERGYATLGVPSEMTGIALARALMLTFKELTPFYYGYKASFWDIENKGVWLTGDDIITLQWDCQAENILSEKLKIPDFVNQVNFHLTSDWGKIKGIVKEIPQKTMLKITGKIKDNLHEYLSINHLKYTQRKNPDGGYIYELTKGSLKKDILFFLETTTETTTLVTGKKFNMTAFTKKCIPQQNIYSTSIQSTFE